MNPKKDAFIQGVLEHGNATKAAKDAGYSEKTAYSQGSRLLKDVEVQHALQQVKGKVAEKLELTAERILGELLRIGCADVGALFDEQGTMKALKDIPAEVRAAISSVEVEVETEKHGKLHKVRFWNKPEALSQLARHLGLFEKDNRQQAESFADLVLRAQRLREKRR